MKTLTTMAAALLAAIMVIGSAQLASAVGNTCARFESQYNSSIRNADRWTGEIQRRTEEAYRLEERIQIRVADLVNQINLAVANAQYMESVSNEQTARCSFNFFWGGNPYCFASASRAAASRRRSAQLRIQYAQIRYNNYVVTIDGQRQRQAQRIIDAQNYYNLALQNANNSSATVQNCYASPPAF